jgi:hypothetical protein
MKVTACFQAGIRVVAGSGFFIPDRFIDLLGALLTVAGLTIVGRAVAGEWIRAATPFLIMMGALGSAAVVTGAAMKALAQEWERADGTAREAYLAAFDGSRQLQDGLFFAAFLALGMYLAGLAPALLQKGSFPRWLGWTSAVASGLILGGNLLSPVIGPSFLAVLAGFAVFLVTLAGLGVSLWRSASRALTEASTPTPIAQRS